MNLTYIVKNTDYSNINQILKNEFNISTRLLNKLIKSKKIFQNNKIADTRNAVTINDKISVNLDFDEESKNILPTNMDLDVIYEDDAFLILNKPAGIAVHPSILHYGNSLSNGVKYYFNKIELKRKIRPVNRLDLNTSGIVIFAKNEYIQECLIRQMQDNIFKKEYLAIIYGKLEVKTGYINLPIARKENSIIERCIDEKGKPSITHYEVIKESKEFSLVRCILETGRTHQIRVHFSHIGHSLLGDTLYGSSSELINRQALHSYKVEFIHPITNKKISLIADLPNDMKNILNNF